MVAPEPEQLARRWAEILGENLPLSRLAEPIELAVRDGWIRFVTGDRARIAGVHLRSVSRDSTSLRVGDVEFTAQRSDPGGA